MVQWVDGLIPNPFFVIPFAEDIGGDLFCFDYRRDPAYPSVVFWSVDTGSVPLADSFTAFLDTLYQDE